MSKNVMRNLGSTRYDSLLITGQAPVVIDTVIIAKGQTLSRGTILGIEDTSGEAYVVDSSKVDGTQIPYAVLADDTDTTEGSEEAAVYLAGEFNVNEMHCGETDAPLKFKSAMRKLGMFLREAQSREDN